MKLKRLIANCIKNVARQNDGTFNEDTLALAVDNPQYSDYLNNVDIDINQAFSRLVTSEKVLTDTIIDEYTVNVEDNKRYYVINIDNDIVDFIYKIKSIVFVDKYGVEHFPSYTKTSRNTIRVDKYNCDGEYHIQYCKTIPYITWEVNGEEDLFEMYGLTDTILNSFVIPFTKSKLWESEEPQLAQQYMNYAETYLNAYDGGDETQYQEFVNVDLHY